MSSAERWTERDERDAELLSASDRDAADRMTGEGGANAPVDVVGFGVEAADGEIGKVDSASYEAGDGWIVVDTGPWIFGRKVMLPAGVIDEIDYEQRTVHVRRSKDEIRHAPEYGEALETDRGYRDALDGYYGALRGRQPW